MSDETDTCQENRDFHDEEIGEDQPVQDTQWYQSKAPWVRAAIDAYPPGIYRLIPTGETVRMYSYTEATDDSCTCCIVALEESLETSRPQLITDVPFSVLEPLLLYPHRRQTGEERTDTP